MNKLLLDVENITRAEALKRLNKLCESLLGFSIYDDKFSAFSVFAGLKRSNPDVMLMHDVIDAAKCIREYHDFLKYKDAEKKGA